MHGPDTPPVAFARIGLPVVMSKRIPTSVLMRLRASAPASTQALAMATISVTLGESFTTIGLSLNSRSLLISRKRARGSVPTDMPPCETLGQLTLISSISAGLSASFATTSA